MATYLDKEENHRLKDDILLDELLKGEFRKSALSQEELNHISRVAEDYLQGKITSPTILSVTENTVLLQVFKQIYVRDTTEFKREAEKGEDRSKRLAVPASGYSLTSKRSKRALVSLSKVRSSKAFLTSKSRSLSVKSFGRKSFSSSTLPSSSISFTGLETDDVIRDSLWQEFFTRYPELDKRLRLMRYNLVNALRDKEEASRNATKLRCRLDDAKLKYEDAQWRRKATLGDAVGPDGQEIRSEEEKEAALEVENINKEFLQARQQAASTHVKYVDILTIYNDLNETARLEFQEYINKVYTTTLILPELESENFKRHSPKTELVWRPSAPSANIKEEEDQELRTYFEHLQMSHGKNLIDQVPSRECAQFYY